MATHSSVLAWRIPGMAEPGGLPLVGSHRVGHDWSDLAAAARGLVLLVSYPWAGVSIHGSNPSHFPGRISVPVICPSFLGRFLGTWTSARCFLLPFYQSPCPMHLYIYGLCWRFICSSSVHLPWDCSIYSCSTDVIGDGAMGREKLWFLPLPYWSCLLGVYIMLY